jgi:predicted nucleic acid-binding protein
MGACRRSAAVVRPCIRNCAAAAIAQPRPDLADTLLHEVGKARNCERTVTFDRKFARLPGVELAA